MSLSKSPGVRKAVADEQIDVQRIAGAMLNGEPLSMTRDAANEYDSIRGKVAAKYRAIAGPSALERLGLLR